MRPVRPRSAVLLAVPLAVLGLLLLASGVSPAPAAAAAVRDVQLTQDGPVPASLTVAAGDSIRFVNTDTFVHRVVSDSANWAFDSRTLVPGASFTVEPALSRAGTYAYRGAGLDSFRGTVVVPGTAASPSASPRRSPSPAVAVPSTASPSASPAASPAAASPGASPAASPAATGGTGSVQGPPPLAGGSFGGFVGPSPSPGAPAPMVADPLAAVPLPTPSFDGASPQVVGTDAGPTTTTALGDLPRLGSPVEARRYGLPLALAAVLLSGVVSLLVRLLLHEAPAPGSA